MLTVMFVVLVSPFAAVDEWTKSFEVTALPQLSIETSDANIRVDTWERNSIEARVITHKWKIGENGIKISDHQTGNTIELEVVFPRRWFQPHLGDRRVDIEVRVPKQSNLNLHTGDGSIRLKNVKGDVRLKTSDGGLEIQGVEGTLQASTGDGKIELADAKGEITLRTGDGHIDVERVEGMLRSILAMAAYKRRGDSTCWKSRLATEELRQPLWLGQEQYRAGPCAPGMAALLCAYLRTSLQMSICKPTTAT